MCCKLLLIPVWQDSSATKNNFSRISKAQITLLSSICMVCQSTGLLCAPFLENSAKILLADSPAARYFNRPLRYEKCDRKIGPIGYTGEILYVPNLWFFSFFPGLGPCLFTLMIGTCERAHVRTCVVFNVHVGIVSVRV
jgi:hypothetical protein